MQTNNLEKWKKLLEEKYGLKKTTSRDAFEFANTLINFFDLLIKFNHEDQIKTYGRNNQKSEKMPEV